MVHSHVIISSVILMFPHYILKKKTVFTCEKRVEFNTAPQHLFPRILQDWLLTKLC